MITHELVGKVEYRQMGASVSSKEPEPAKLRTLRESLVHTCSEGRSMFAVSVKDYACR